MWQLQLNRVQKLFTSIWSLNLNSLKNYCLIFTIIVTNSFRKKYSPVNVSLQNIVYNAPRKITREHTVAGLSVRPSVSQSVGQSVRPIRVRHITSLFEVGFHNYYTEMTTMLSQRVACNFEGQGHSMTLQQNRVRPITLLFEVLFRNYFT